jgi:hypothetical protein
MTVLPRFAPHPGAYASARGAALVPVAFTRPGCVAEGCTPAGQVIPGVINAHGTGGARAAGR